MPKYRLYTYDIWGNDEDGYTVNDLYRQSDIFEITDNMTDKEIIKLLDFTNPEKIIIMDRSEHGVYFENYDNCKPVCELRLED